MDSALLTKVVNDRKEAEVLIKELLNKSVIYSWIQLNNLFKSAFFYRNFFTVLFALVWLRSSLLLQLLDDFRWSNTVSFSQKETIYDVGKSKNGKKITIGQFDVLSYLICPRLDYTRSFTSYVADYCSSGSNLGRKSFIIWCVGYALQYRYFHPKYKVNNDLKESNSPENVQSH